MKTENLLLLAVAGLAIYYFFFKKNGSADWGGGGGGGTIIDPTQPIQPIGPGVIISPAGNVVGSFNPPPVVSIPIGIVANVPAGVVKGGSGRIEGVLIKGKTNALFFTPGAAQTSSFMNKAIAGGKTFPLNKPNITVAPSVKNLLSKTTVGKSLLMRLK